MGGPAWQCTCPPRPSCPALRTRLRIPRNRSALPGSRVNSWLRPRRPFWPHACSDRPTATCVRSVPRALSGQRQRSGSARRGGQPDGPQALGPRPGPGQETGLRPSVSLDPAWRPRPSSPARSATSRMAHESGGPFMPQVIGVRFPDTFLSSPFSGWGRSPEPGRTGRPAVPAAARDRDRPGTSPGALRGGRRRPLRPRHSPGGPAVSRPARACPCGEQVTESVDRRSPLISYHTLLG